MAQQDGEGGGGRKWMGVGNTWEAELTGRRGRLPVGHLQLDVPW